jgi:phage tail-like protein
MDLIQNLMFPYPPVSFHFDVRVIDDLSGQPLDPVKMLMAGAKAMSEAGFQEVSGLTATMQTEDVEEGGENRFTYKLPKRVGYPNLVLKRGAVTRPSVLNMWCEDCLTNAKFPIKTKIVVLSLLNEQHLPIMIWKFEKAYPVKYEVSGFNAESNQLLIENIEIAYQRFERVAAPATMAIAAASSMLDVPSLPSF